MPTAAPADLSPYINLSDPLYQGNLMSYFSGRPTPTNVPGFYGALQSYPQITNDMSIWSSPQRRNPIPLPDVPGASVYPSTTYRRMANQTQAVRDLMPYLTDTVLQTMMPAALAELDVSRATSGPKAQLMLDLYNTYGPALNAVGNEITRRNALAQAETDRQVISGPGRDLVTQAMETAKIADPEYYATRAATAKRVQDLLGNIDLTGGLSGVENDQIAKGLTREGQSRGVANAPSNTEIVSNAMTYGQAGRTRQLENENRLSQAIQASSQFIPTSKSGIDVFQVATGRPSMANTGNSLFTGLNQGNADNAYGLAGSLFGNATNLTNAQVGADASKPSELDKIGQIVGMAGDFIGSVAGGIAGCWVAREVYGEDNPRWEMFREWLIHKAPRWFYNLYCKHGPRFAKFISNKPTLKYIIRKWMDIRIRNYYGQQNIGQEKNSYSIKRIFQERRRRYYNQLRRFFSRGDARDFKDSKQMCFEFYLRA